MQELLTVAKAARAVAEEIGIPLNRSTLRGWTSVEQFQPFLSDAATPESGTVRRFTPHDIKVIAAIARLRERGLSYDEIAAALPDVLSAPADKPDDAPDAQQNAPDAPGAPLATREADSMAAALQEAVTASHSERMATLEQRVNQLEATRYNVPMILAAFAVGALVVLIAFAIAFALIG